MNPLFRNGDRRPEALFTSLPFPFRFITFSIEALV